MLRVKHLKILFNGVSTNSRRDEIDREAKKIFQQSRRAATVLYGGSSKTRDLELTGAPSYCFEDSLQTQLTMQNKTIKTVHILIILKFL